MTTYHVRHIGSRTTAHALVAQGWRVLGEYPPLSPVIDYAGWLRCPEHCCPTSLAGTMEKVRRRIEARA